MKIGVLGPRGTYSELAARAHYGDQNEFVYYPTITEVEKGVERAEVEIGVVPLESLREGSVGETLDVLAWGNVKIKEEIVLPISISLLVLPGTKLEQISQILSHPQVLAQCREFLQELPNVELVEVSSTARAAEQVAKAGKPQIACLGPKSLAQIYSLEPLLDDIQGEINLTRFLALSQTDSPPTGYDKTSIVFYTAEDRPGILWEILGEFATRKINLTKIESRPSKRALGDYLFFLDFEGHREEEKVKEALEGVRKKTAMLKVLGSYPRRF
jgi:prephenate dehydratase